MGKHLYWGHFRVFRPSFSLRHTRLVVRHGHFTLKQLKLPVLNEMHTNSCTGPRLIPPHKAKYLLILRVLAGAFY